MSGPARAPHRLAIHSALEVVSVAEVEQQRDEIGARFFATEEFEPIAGRRAQTTAGFLAAKRALVRLFTELSGRPFHESDFLLAHQADGAPRVRSFPSISEAERGVRISISHTRQYAYGLAVVEGERRG